MGFTPSPPLLPCSDLEGTEALLSSGASLVLEMNRQFISAEPGFESHSCVSKTAPGSALPVGSRQTPEAVVRSYGLSGPTSVPITVCMYLAGHSGCPSLSQPGQMLASSSFWNVLSLLLLWAHSHSTFEAQFKSHLLCGVFQDGTLPLLPGE